MAWESLRSAVTAETFEKLNMRTQQVVEQTAGGMIVTTPANVGDFVDMIMFGANQVGAVRDRSTGAGTATPTELAQQNHTKVNVPLRYGPFFWGADSPQWQGLSESAIVNNLSSQAANYIILQQIQLGTSACVGALENADDAVNDISASAGASIQAVNNTLALLGDAYNAAACVMLNSAMYFKITGNALDNSNSLYEQSTIQVTNFMGKPYVVVDSPAFTVSTTDYKALILNASGITCDSKGQPVSAMTQETGDNITNRFQQDSSFDLGVRGFAYGGTANPTAAELATGTNWTADYDSAKNAAGALLVTDQS